MVDDTEVARVDARALSVSRSETGTQCRDGTARSATPPLLKPLSDSTVSRIKPEPEIEEASASTSSVCVDVSGKNEGRWWNSTKSSVGRFRSC